MQNSVGAWQYEAGSTEMARVRNVVAVLPGSDSTGRLFLMAHHDSVETGPGAADDAAGVSALLESVRALAAGRSCATTSSSSSPTPRRPASAAPRRSPPRTRSPAAAAWC